MLISSMSRTSTSSSWFASNVVVSTLAGSTRRPAKSSAYARATRAGVRCETVAVRVLTDRDEDLPDRLLDARQVDGLLHGCTGELAVDQARGEIVELVGVAAPSRCRR